VTLQPPTLDLYSLRTAYSLSDQGSLVFPSTMIQPSFSSDLPTTGLYLLSLELSSSPDQEDSLSLYQLASGVRLRKFTHAGFPLSSLTVYHVTQDTKYIVYGGYSCLGLCKIDEEVSDQMGYIADRVTQGEDIWSKYEIGWAPRQRVVDERMQKQVI